ncbi:Disks large-associated protein [Trichinella pseudospiralis]
MMLYRLAFTLVQSVQSVNQTIRVTFLDRMRSAAVSSTSRRSCHYLSNQVEPTSRCIMQQVLLDIAIGRCCNDRNSQHCEKTHDRIGHGGEKKLSWRLTKALNFLKLMQTTTKWTPRNSTKKRCMRMPCKSEIWIITNWMLIRSGLR